MPCWSSGSRNWTWPRGVALAMSFYAHLFRSLACVRQLVDEWMHN